MKIELTKDVNGNPIVPPHVEHVDSGTGATFIAAGMAKEVFPAPIPHKQTEWRVVVTNDGYAPYVSAKCNCRQNNKTQFEGPTVKLVVRHVLCQTEGLAASTLPEQGTVGYKLTGDYVSLGGYNSNLVPIKIVVEHAPKEIETKYRVVYADWAKQFARKPKVKLPIDRLNEERELAMRGQITGSIFPRP